MIAIAAHSEIGPVHPERAAGAEAIPLQDDSVDAATAGQSFHWFRLDEAVPEVHRVLRPGAGLGLVWNMRDQDDGLQREITALLAPFVPPGREGEGPGVTEFFRQEALAECRCGVAARWTWG